MNMGNKKIIIKHLVAQKTYESIFLKNISEGKVQQPQINQYW